MKTVIDYIEEAMRKVPDRVVLADDVSEMTGSELISASRMIGTGIACKESKIRQPIAIFMEKTPMCVAAMVGTAYSGNFYTVLDVHQPADRVKSILDTIQPMCILTSGDLKNAIVEIAPEIKVYDVEELLVTEINADRLRQIRSMITDTDILYVLFTSGSTGVPKGVIISHKAVIAYEKWAVDTFNINEDTVWGSQTPFYFSMSLTDLYSTLFTGACLHIIPKSYFSFPTMLLDYMNERKINSIYWVPSAYGILMKWKAFSYKKPEHLKLAMFAGEVMPVKYLNYWRSALPDVEYNNLFGPTETTDICTWYHVNREFDESDSLPIGISCDNCDSFVLSGDNTLVDVSDTETTGELYVRGSFLAYGYYNNKEKTEEAFVQNPLHDIYPEKVYRTGDLVRYNEYGELIYAGRRDLQIKHMGYRIEPGEIENTIGIIEGVDIAVCVYVSSRDQIVVFYQGKLKTDKLNPLLIERLPIYMRPQKIEKVKSVVYNANGKIDRNYYKNLAENMN